MKKKVQAWLKIWNKMKWKKIVVQNVVKIGLKIKNMANIEYWYNWWTYTWDSYGVTFIAADYWKKLKKNINIIVIRHTWTR